MHKLRAVAFIGVAIMLAGVGSHRSEGQQPSAPVDVHIVKYSQLCDFVLAQKGKVVLLDFWATTCPPCRASFFHTVEMNKRYRDKGLVVVSVSTDPVVPGEEAKLKARVVKFLDAQGATFTNVILDEPAKVAETKLRMTTIPCLYVFNRDGQWTQFIGENGLKEDANHRHPEIENYVKALVDQPAKAK